MDRADRRCDYCDTVLDGPAEARRHVLTIAHYRNKTSYDLSIAKYVERKRQSETLPKNFQELCNLLNMRSEKDVVALKENGFFKMTNDWHYKIAEELIQVMCLADNDYFVKRLPEELRKPFVEMVESRRKETNSLA